MEVSYLASSILNSYDKILHGARFVGTFMFEYTEDGLYTINLHSRTYVGLKPVDNTLEAEIDIALDETITVLSETDVIDKDFKFRYDDVNGTIGDKVLYLDLEINFVDFYFESNADFARGREVVVVKIVIENLSNEPKSLYRHHIEYYSQNGLDTSMNVSNDVTGLGNKIPAGELYNGLLIFEFDGEGDYTILFSDGVNWEDRVTVSIPVYK